MLASELVERQRGEIIETGKKQPDPFIFSPELVRDLELMAFARRVLELARGTKPILTTGGSGRPDTDSDKTILVTILVMVVWQLSPRQMVKRLKRWEALAAACGYSASEIISASQLYEGCA